MSLITESLVEGHVKNALPALPGKCGPLQQGPNALSVWLCSHSCKTDHTKCTRICRETEILFPPLKSMLEGCKDKVSTPQALQEAIKEGFYSTGFNFVSE